jgi:DNA adenine methylase
VGGGSIIIEVLRYCWENKINNCEFICADINPIIIKMYNEIKNNPQELIERLEQYENINSEDDYYRIRKEYNTEQTVEKFMFLNKKCFRGMYRVNKKGEFNTSFSSARSPPVFIRENILELSKLFNYYNVKFDVANFFDLEFENCTLYCDLVYYGTFDEYSAQRFDHDEYVRKLNLIRENKSVKLVHSNSVGFLDIYVTNEKIEEIICQERMNATNMNDRRVELLFY